MSSVDALLALVDQHGEDLPLDRALLAVALDEYPSLEEQPYLRQLDRWGQRVAQVTAAGTLGMDAVRQVLFLELGFRGNTDAYYAPANSLFNLVIERRTGIPITLAAVYIEVARRAGEDADGVGFPGHFLVVHRADGQSHFIDPFNEGAVLTRQDCAERLETMSEGQVELADWMLAPSSGRAIVTRVLTNLKMAYAKGGDVPQAIRAVDRLLAVAPDRIEERRDRGLLYAELGLANAAATDIEAYLAAVPDAPDQAQLQYRLPQLWAAARRMN